MDLLGRIVFRQGIIIAALLALVLGACSKNVEQSADQQSTDIGKLVGTSWRVEDVASGGVIDRSNLTLNFGEDGRISGSSGCNNYTGGYSATGIKLEVGRLAGTMMACPPALMDLEQKFLNVLGDAENFSIDADKGILIITASNGRTLRATQVH